MTGHALAVAATVSFLAGLAPQQASWTTYTSVEGRYSISLPQQPQLSSEELGKDATPFLQHTAQVVADGNVYMAVWTDPPIADTPRDKQHFLESARDALIKTVNGVHITTVPYGNPGIEFTVNIAHPSGARLLRARMFLIGMRAYTLLMMTHAGRDASELERRFFGSFKAAPQ